jgi:hypothetical protein
MITHGSARAAFVHVATAARPPLRTPQLASRQPGSIAVEPRSHPHPKHFELAISAPASCMLVRMELVNLCLLRCAARNDKLIMRYAF